MMLLPIEDLLDEERCFRMLLDALHPDGIRCPNGHALPADQAPDDRHRAPVMDYRCRECGRVFNLYRGTALQGVRYGPSRLVMILRGFCSGQGGCTKLHEIPSESTCSRYSMFRPALARFAAIPRTRFPRREVSSRRRSVSAMPLIAARWAAAFAS
jgi:hypothetical protein